jgi:hypothetical protein
MVKLKGRVCLLGSHPDVPIDFRVFHVDFISLSPFMDAL